MNPFKSVIGQDRLKKRLASVIEQKRLAHAYLFQGPRGVGKDAMAIRIAMGLNCANGSIEGCGQCGPCRQFLRLEHPAFHLIIPVPTRPKSMNQGKYNELVNEKMTERINNPYQEISFAPAINALPSIGIEQIRNLKHHLILKQQSEYRIILISHADSMTLPASNSLLKLLEEPPAGTLLFLTTSMLSRILPTITSRCQNLRFDALSDADIENALIEQWHFDNDNARFFSKMANGSLYRALSLADAHFEELRSEAWNFLAVSLQGNHLKRLDTCDTLIRELDKSGIHSLLQLLLTWLRDLLCIQSGVQERVINHDRAIQLNRFLNQFGDLSLEQAILETEHAIASLHKNVYLNLIIHTLSQKLNKLAKGRTAA
jgi:DNA polymerase-3 subunit delta'